jgi:simple sugar transport system permease protein
MLSFIGASFISDIPIGLDKFSTADLVKFESDAGTLVRLHVLVIPVAIITI